MNNQYFELPHLNCDLLEIDTIPYNMYVQSLQMPFEVFAVNNFYGVILHAQPSAQSALVRDNITNEIFSAPISEFIGTIPHKPK